MKSLIAGILICGSVGLFFTNAGAQTPSPVRYYGLEHGIIKYEITGSVNGKETLYFDQWGLRQVRKTTAETSRWGTTSTVTLNLGAEIITYDLSKNLGQKKEDKNLKQLLADYKPENDLPLSLQGMVAQGWKKIADENFLNFPCEIWQGSSTGTKAWVFNGIALKMQTQTADGEVTLTAVSFDQTTLVEESIFSVPQDIRFIERDINEILISQSIKSDL